MRAKMAPKGTNWQLKFGIVAKPFATVLQGAITLRIYNYERPLIVLRNDDSKRICTISIKIDNFP